MVVSVSGQCLRVHMLVYFTFRCGRMQSPWRYREKPCSQSLSVASAKRRIVRKLELVPAALSLFQDCPPLDVENPRSHLFRLVQKCLAEGDKRGCGSANRDSRSGWSNTTSHDMPCIDVRLVSNKPSTRSSRAKQSQTACCGARKDESSL